MVGRAERRAGASRRTGLPPAVLAVVALASWLATVGGAWAAPPRSHAGHRSDPGLSARVIGRDGAAILRTGRVRVSLSGPRGLRLRVTLTLAGTGTHRRGRRALAAGVRASAPGLVRLSSRTGQGRLSLALTVGARQRLRLALATCRAVAVTIHLLGHRHHTDRHDRLGATGSGCARPRPGPMHLPGTPGGGFPLSGLGSGSASGPRPASFRVGAAVSDFSPPPAGQPVAGGDPTAACDPTGAFSGPRGFAFTEPYQDARRSGHYDGPTGASDLLGVPDPSHPPQPPYPGDPFQDCNHNGRWEGNLIGGGGGNPRFYTRVIDPVTARAMVVSNGARTIAVEVVDQEGLFNVYQQAIRDRVAADGVRLDGIFISATHDESAPDSLGLGGVNATTSGTNDYWIAYFVARSAQAIEQAYRQMRPATVRYTEVLEPANLRQCWSSYPYVDDQHMPVLQAVGTDGKPIVTLASVSQHTETLGFNGGSATDPGTPATTLQTEKTWLSADWPYFFRSALERRYGGVAIEMAGSVGSVESPEVYASQISRTPHQYVDSSHPAGCRTTFNVRPNDQDAAGKEHVALGYHAETQVFGEQLAGPIIAALDSGAYAPSTSNDVWGDRANICVPLDNLLFAAAAHAGVFAHRPGYNSDCSVQAPVAPNGSSTGQAIQSQVGAFRIGDGEFLSLPGEVFPFTFLRSSLGPADMPNGSVALPPWLLPHLHAPFRFIDGLGEDMIGYIFPRGNAVGVPTAANPGAVNSSDDQFACHHSDDSEAASPSSADLVGNAMVSLLDHHGGAAETIVTGRYVLPDGKTSRNPVGLTDAVKCKRDTTFTGDGEAVGVELADATVVHPASWMSLSGLPQVRPDRDTRGYINASGHRVWLDVFPDLSLR